MTIPQGSIDIHVHAGPSVLDRKHDVIELAEIVQDTNMRGFLVKSHFGNTYALAELANKHVDRVEVFASLAMNSFTGGFNETAVEYALTTGVKILWFPTISAKNFSKTELARSFPVADPLLTVFDRNDEVKPEVRSILELVADSENPITLANGHLSPRESSAVFDVMEEISMKNPFLITHPDSTFTGFSMEDQIEFAERGAMIEKCYWPVINNDIDISEMVDSIEVLGPKNCVISTDLGQSRNLSPPVAYERFVEELMEGGLTDGEIRRMTVENPRVCVDEFRQ